MSDRAVLMEAFAAGKTEWLVEGARILLGQPLGGYKNIYAAASALGRAEITWSQVVATMEAVEAL